MDNLRRNGVFDRVVVVSGMLTAALHSPGHDRRFLRYMLTFYFDRLQNVDNFVNSRSLSIPTMDIRLGKLNATSKSLTKCVIA